MEPSSYTLKPLETLERLVKAPAFLADPSSAFAEYMIDNIIRPSAVNSSISANAIVVISQAHMGVALFKQQRDTSRLLAGLVYKLLIPDNVVPTGTRFCRRYRITDQREAQQGSYDTITNGVQTREYSQVFHHTSKVVTMQFGCLLGVTVRSVAIDLIARELERVSTSWELTRTIDLLRYCVAQPTLTDRVAQRTKTHNRGEKLDAILVMAELLCGMINIQPDSFICALENARRVLGSDKPEVLIVGDTLFRVISQRSSQGTVWSQIHCEDTTLVPEFSVYTMANETNRGGGEYEFVMQQVTQHALSNKTLSFKDDSAFHASASETKVHYIRVGGGPTDRIPIVHIDAVQMEHGSNRDTSTEHKAFCNSDGFKWEYFTVGCMAPAVNQINPSHVLSATNSEDINYKQLAQRSPSVSYIHQYDGAVACVHLRSLHAIGNPEELFSRERRLKLQNDLNALMRGDPAAIPVDNLARLAHSNDWYGKIKNPASVLEFDTRFMAVPVPQGVRSAGNAVPERWVVRPRVTLLNSSPMNNINGEMAQIGSELLAHFADTEHAKNVQENLKFLEKALHHEHGIESMREMRTAVLRGQPTACLNDADWIKGRSYWSWIADPICAVHMRHALAHKESCDQLAVGERTVLIQLEALTNGIVSLFKGIVGHRNNSVIASMPAVFGEPAQAVVCSHGYPRSFTLDEVDYCNLMYWIILPALGARVYRQISDGDFDTTSGPLQYRPEELNLVNVLNLSNESALAVGRLPADCVFSKVLPQKHVDVSEQFEPTASTHKRCTDAGFSDTSVVTYLWAIRLQKLACIGNNLAKVLLGMHYSTLITHNVLRDHYDTKYYSGVSYLLFRGVRFTGCGVSLMQQKSALYTLGTEIVCKPTAHNTHQVHTVNQYCESSVIPDTLESPGVYMPNLYMKDVRGGDVSIDTGDCFDMVVAEAFNGFCPESDGASGYRRPYIFTTGRSVRLNGSITRDPLMRAEAYTCMPTLHHPFSSVLRARHKPVGRHRNKEESNRKLFCKTLHVGEFEKGVLDPIGDPFKDTVDRVNGDKRTTDIMQPTLGVAFCGTYGIGYTSDRKLMSASDETRQTVVDRLAPRVSGTGIFSSNPIPTTYRLINPIFNRIFESSRYSRVLQC